MYKQAVVCLMLFMASFSCDIVSSMGAVFGTSACKSTLAVLAFDMWHHSNPNMPFQSTAHSTVTSYVRWFANAASQKPFPQLPNPAPVKSCTALILSVFFALQGSN
jgi:hypothetical protein